MTDAAVQEEVKEMLEEGLIELFYSQWAFLTFLVSKKDGSYRLNRIMKQDP